MILSEALQLPAEERVHHGETYLDHELPGWYLYINPEILDLRRPEACILGQLHDAHPSLRGVTFVSNAYDTVVLYLDPDYPFTGGWGTDGDAWPVQCGFHSPAADLDTVSFEALREAWHSVLARRQAHLLVRPGSTPPVVTVSAEQDFTDGMMGHPVYDNGQ